MNRRLAGDKGIALILVLWVMTLLSVMSGEFAQTMRTEINITGNYKEETQCYYFARSGIDLAVHGLLKKTSFPVLIEAGTPIAPEESAAEWRVGENIPSIAFGNGSIELQIENESGKININTAQSGLLKMMLNPFDLDEQVKSTIVDSIQDWRDPDDLHRLNGAESDYYQSLPTPYSAKNGDFDSVEELLLVKGITPEIFYGGLSEMVTIYSGKEPKSDAAPTGRRAPARAGRGQPQPKKLPSDRININAASPLVLRALPRMTDDLVQAVLEARAEKPFESLPELAQIVGKDVYAAISPYLTTDLLPLYTIRSTGRNPESNARHGIKAVVELDATLPDQYRILEWLDNMEFRPKPARS